MFKEQSLVSVRDVPEFVQLLRDAVYEQGDCERARATCDRMEEFLSKAGPEIRDMLVVEIFESLQDVGSLSDTDSFARFRGPETKRLWAELQAIWKASAKLDLPDRTVLEGEVLIWRICADLRQLHT